MRRMLPLAGLLLVACRGGCGAKHELDACGAGPTGATPIFGDANGDGVVDVSDGVLLARHSLSGGPPPVCQAAVDFTGKGYGAETGHAAGLWYFLFSGTMDALPTLADGACATLDDPGDPPGCAYVGLGLEDVDSTDTTMTVAVTVDTEGVDRGPEAWSYGVRAEGCAITAATTAGTEAADVWDDEPGLRTEGFDRTDVNADGDATSAVVLSWRKPVGLGTGSHRIALLDVALTPPSKGCVPCELEIVGGVRGPGQPVDVAVDFGGFTYEAHATGISKKVCAR